MHPNYHSLYAGLICGILLLFSRAPLAAVIILIPICILCDFAQWRDRLKSSNDAKQFAVVALVQCLMLTLVFGVMMFMLHR